MACADCWGAWRSPSLRPYGLAPLVLDVGTAVGLVGVLSLLRETWQTCRCNLLSEYVGLADGKAVRLRLFRHGVFTLQQEFRRAPGEFGLVACSTIGEWSQTNDELRLGLYGEEATFRIVDGGGQTTLRQAAGCNACEANKDLSLAGMTLRLHDPAPEGRVSGR